MARTGRAGFIAEAFAEILYEVQPRLCVQLEAFEDRSTVPGDRSGTTWSKVDMGNAVNKIRVLKSPDTVTAFAIGTHVHRLTMPAVNPAEE